MNILKKKRFTKINEGFTCKHCNKEVLATKRGSPRNHCPFCLWGMHLDIYPGDRESKCHGMLQPIGAITDPRKEFIIIHRCVRCNEKKRSRAILHDKGQNDDLDLIIELSKNPIEDSV